MSGVALPPLLALALVTQAQDAVSHVARGMLGGLFNTLVAPLVFTSVIEYPAVLILAPLATDPRWQPLPAQPGTRVWTDDYSDVVRALRWFR